MKYRIVVGEKGNEYGHVQELPSTVTEKNARDMLKKALKRYNGDGWGRVEYLRTPELEDAGWDRLP